MRHSSLSQGEVEHLLQLLWRLPEHNFVLVSGENYMPKQDLHDFFQELSVLVAVRYWMEVAHPAIEAAFERQRRLI